MFERGRRSVPSTLQQPQLIGSNSEQSEDCRMTRDIFGYPGGTDHRGWRSNDRYRR
ncbi:MAG: hypothetical protein Ct9H300mP1_32680 [Planctomycetaceae bacterium]|nr:MAG: hypothetical protein Ct9H300mP1_32680 [Planctomycetaceae bacterium]